MTEHLDVMVGATSADNGASIEVLVSGVDVRLTVRRRDRDDVVIFLGPDEAISLRDLLDQALEV
jgi:hypothetical protein